MAELLALEFVRNAIAAGALASLLCGLVGTFVVVKRLVFISGGISHAAFGGLGLFYFLGLEPLVGAAAAAVLAAALLSGRSRASGRSSDTTIGVLWAVGMALGVVFIARTPGYTPHLTTYLFGDILSTSRPLLAALAALALVVLLSVAVFFKELLAVSFDEEFARSQGLATRAFLLLLMVLIALSVVMLIQVVGVVLAIALLTIPPAIGLAIAGSFRGAMLLAIAIALGMTLGGLAISFAGDLPSGPTIVLLGFTLLLAARVWTWSRRRAARLAAGLVLALTISTPAGSTPSDSDAAPAAPTAYRHLELLGVAEIGAIEHDGVPLGGLSGIVWDRHSGELLAVSDDRAERGPARYYTLRIDLASGRLEPDGVEVVGMTALTTGGHAFGPGRVDPEAIALTDRGELIIASEGDARIELEPFLRIFDREGRQLDELPLGRRYAPRADGQSGVRNNLALESASIEPGGRYLFSATENALAQDGPVSDLRQGSPGRILKYDLERRQLVAEYLYPIEPVVEPPEPAGSFATNGVVEVLALDEWTLWVLERSFSVGRGNDVRIYEVDLTEASDIRTIESLRRHEGDVRAAAKRLLLDVDALGVTPDNLEGMAFGPPLTDGRPTLLLLADDNFDPVGQSTQVLAFGLGASTPGLPAIQGAGHRSPFDGDWVRGVEGVVTAVDPDERRGGFWMQAAPDGDPATSDGLRVALPAPEVAVGERLRVDGAVRELAHDGELPVTTLVAGRVERGGSTVATPAPLALGPRGRVPPAVVIDDDRLERFDPCCDAIDFFESLEGMRVALPGARVVGATSRFGQIVVEAPPLDRSSLRSAAGGLVLLPGQANPRRLVLSARLIDGAPDLGVGDRFEGDLTGVLDYAFGNFQLLVEAWPETIASRRSPPLRRPDRPGEISIASYNVLNLDGEDPEEQFARLADSIVRALAAPAILGLQEIQDDNGARDRGVVSASLTLTRLLDAIETAGGPRYEYLQIDPLHNADGGQPNGNIRVVWLFDPSRVTLRRPRRIAAGSPAFAGDPERHWEGGRKCLAVDATLAGRETLLVNCHLKSKRGDDRWFGARQPPIFLTEEIRAAQVRALLAHLDQARAEGREVILLGDMNEHEFRAPMRLLVSRGLVNLVKRIEPAERYSYNFNGNSQLLDHVLMTPGLAAAVTDVTIVHVNADFAEAQRPSDHDPVAVRLALP